MLVQAGGSIEQKINPDTLRVDKIWVELSRVKKIRLDY